jgi:hypothetical protein
MNIDAYHFGEIDIDGRTYTSDVIITPERVRDSWWRQKGHRLAVEDLTDIVAARPDVLVIGTGYLGRMFVSDEARQYLQDHGIEVHESHTREAAQEFNRLQQTHQRVVGALHLTC